MKKGKKTRKVVLTRDGTLFPRRKQDKRALKLRRRWVKLGNHYGGEESRVGFEPLSEDEQRSFAAVMQDQLALIDLLMTRLEAEETEFTPEAAAWGLTGKRKRPLNAAPFLQLLRFCAGELMHQLDGIPQRLVSEALARRDSAVKERQIKGGPEASFGEVEEQGGIPTPSEEQLIDVLDTSGR